MMCTNLLSSDPMKHETNDCAENFNNSMFSFRWVSSAYESKSNEAKRKTAMLCDKNNELILFFEYWVSFELKYSLKRQE